MIKVAFPHDTKSNTGGGSTFYRNFKSGMSNDIHLVDDVDGSDALFIAGATLCDRSTVEHAKANGIPIVLRVDNVPEDIRNRGTGISRLREFAQAATVVVFQSEWSKHVAGAITGTQGEVIYNGVDTKIFSPGPGKREKDPTFIYVKHSRNECKRFDEAQMLFREYAREHSEAKLIVVGRYSEDLPKYNFGFYSGENIEYLGILDPFQLADQYRRAHVLLFPSFGDSCPNTVLEAMSSGCEVVYHPWGGTRELVGEEGIRIRYEDFHSPRLLLETAIEVSKLEMHDTPRKRVERLFTLERMVKDYEGVIRLVSQK